MPTHACPRCAAKGELKCYAHIKGGVCFRCWGTALDLPGIRLELIDALNNLRQEWLKARRSGATKEALAKIEIRGRRAALALHNHEVDSEAQHAKFKAA